MGVVGEATESGRRTSGLFDVVEKGDSGDHVCAESRLDGRLSTWGLVDGSASSSSSSDSLSSPWRLLPLMVCPGEIGSPVALASRRSALARWGRAR